MTFLEPIRLWLLLVAVVLLAAYLVVQRRRSTYAARLADLDLLASVLPRRPGWWRHVPAALLLIAVVALTTAFARPTAEVEVPRERATVLLALDTSVSMSATDVEPDRFTAAKRSAIAFVKRLPQRFNVGLVAFDASARVVVPPTLDHSTVVRSLRTLELGERTAIGEAVIAAASTLPPGEPVRGDDRVPVRLVLLSDGENTAGRPLEEGAQVAREARMPVSTIAFGTPEGRLGTMRVAVNEVALQQLADETGGSAYTAETRNRLDRVYRDVESQVGTERTRQEVTAWLAGAGLLAAIGAAAGSLLWSNRLV